MRGYPILPSTLDNRLTVLENRIRRLGQPHDVAIVKALEAFSLNIAPDDRYDPLNVWTDQYWQYTISLYGAYLTGKVYKNDTTVANQEYELRYYQQTPSVPSSYYVLDSGTIPLASTSPSFTLSIDISGFSPTISGTAGYLQFWTKRTSSWVYPDVVGFAGTWFLGGQI